MKKFVKIILVLTIICFTACSTKQKEETLLTIENLLEIDPDSALILTSVMKNKLLTRYGKAKVILYETIAKNKLDMDISFNTDIFNAAEIILKKGTDIEKAKVLLYAGKVHHQNNDNENALIYAIDAKKYGLMTDDNNLKGLILADIGSLYYEGLYKDSALNNYKQALNYYAKTDNYNDLTKTLMLAGNCFLMLENKDSALCCYNEALKILENYENNSLQSGLLINMGVLYNIYEDYSNSLQMLKTALSISENQKDSLYIYLNLSETYFLISDMDSATYFINKCFDILNDSESKYTPETYYSAYYLFSTIEENNGNLKNALVLKDELLFLADSIYSEISKQKLIEIQEKYNYEKVENENKKLKLEKQNYVLLILSFTIICLLLTISSFWIKRKRILTEKKLLEAQQKLHTLELKADKYMKKMNEFFRDVVIGKNKKINKELLDKLFPVIISLLNIEKYETELNYTRISICCLLFFGFEKKEIIEALPMSSQVFDTRCSEIRTILEIPKRGNIGLFVAKKLTEN